MDGIKGKVFKHMLYHQDSKTCTPHKETKFGAGISIVCRDVATSGSMTQLSVDATLTVLQDYFTMDIYGEAGIGFSSAAQLPKVGERFGNSSVLLGTGSINFNSRDKHLLGNFSVRTNTAPYLCANADLGFDIKPGSWNVWAGRRDNPITVKLLCKDWIAFNSWFDVSNERVQLGIEQEVNVYARSPWLKVAGKDVRPYAGFGFHFLAQTEVEFQPKVKVREAQLKLAAHAAIGAEYKKDDEIKEWTLAGAYLSGNCHYKNTDKEAFIEGSLSGKIVVCMVKVGVNMEVKHDLRPAS